MNNSTEQRLRDDLIELEDKTTSEDLFGLAQARKNALLQNRRTGQRLLWPALATSFACVVLIAVLYSPALSIMSPETGIAADDYFSELSEENFDLYDDLDFYDWLADAEG